MPSCIERLSAKDCLSSDTNFQLSDYDAHNFSIASEIDPGRFDVRFLWPLNGFLLRPCAELSYLRTQAYNADLTPFAGPSHHGKLIHYVGWADHLITASASLDYYETVRNFTESNTKMKMEDFYRMFPVPGMLHWYALHRP